MNTPKEMPVYTTADLRKNLGEALGKAHYQGEVVSISHHGKPYAAVVSEQGADLLRTLSVLTKGRLDVLKERVEKLVEEGKGLGDLVEDLEESATFNPQDPPAKNHSGNRITGSKLSYG